MRLFKITILFLIISTTTLSVYSQSKKSYKKTYAKGVDFFNQEDYQAALNFFTQVDSIDFEYKLEVKYYIGACYLNIPQQKEKALPFLEYVIKTNESIVPAHIFKDLGIIYLHKHDFEKSNTYFKKYQSISLFETTSLSDVNPKEYIEWVKNAKKFVKDSSDVKIEKISKTSNYSEFSPYISADESELFFMRTTISKQTRWDSITQIMYSTKHGSGWNNPVELKIENAENKTPKLAGINPDGQLIYVFFDNKLHSCYVDNKNNTCTNLQDITEISPESSQEHLSISADGNTIYFSANTTTGFGGKDIFYVTKKSNGKWSTPTNLGNKINTHFDEIMPFIHPDNKTLYFVSKGHNSMGGYDIFKTILLAPGKWSKPINLGYPINSTFDDLNFSLSAQSNTAYLSRKENVFSDQMSIYKVTFNKSVPLTLVKGVILAGNPLMPIGAKIQVIDKETNTKVKYIYNPNPLTGKFLMIFPPGKNYDMIVNADNYLPQLINIYVPNQTYFYELFQEIHLKPVVTLGKVVGEEIYVRNNFYDVNKLNKSGIMDSSQVSDNQNLQQIVNSIVSITDSLNSNDINLFSEILYSKNAEIKPKKDYSNLLNLINKAIETTDTTFLNKLNKETIYEQKSNQNYFYSENNKFNLIPYVLDKDTIYTAPSVNSSLSESTKMISMKQTQLTKSDDSEQNKIDSLIIRKVDVEKQKIIISYPITYIENQTIFNKKHLVDIFELSQLVLNNKRLAIEIESLTSSNDSTTPDNILAAKRIESIISALNDNDITKSKYVVNKKIGTNSKSEINVKVFEIISNDTISKIITKEKVESLKTNKKTVAKHKTEEVKEIKEVKKVDEKLNNISEQGIIYKIQIKATKKQLNTNHLEFKGLAVTRYFHEGMYKYVVGSFSNESEAEKYKIEMIKNGFEDAFIVKFDKDERIK